MNTESTEWKVVSWILSILLILVLIGSIFWGIFYSDLLANSSLIIPIRSQYQDTYLKVVQAIYPKQVDSSKPTTLYTIQPQESLVFGMYTYTFTGTFSSVDGVNSLIYLKGPDGRLYSFRIDDFVLRDTDTWLRIFTVPDIQTLSTGMTFPIGVLPPDNAKNVLKTYNTIMITSNIPAIKFGTIAVRWNDTRTLTQIENDFSKNPIVPLNNTSPGSTVLAKFE